MTYRNEVELPELRDSNDQRKLLAMKIEKQSGCERPVLKLDVCILAKMRGVVGFPQLIVAGRTEDYKAGIYIN
uniref:Glutaredoxin domain-containing protein n=1 Tax=Heterorhabditis bacteriophora TaxID=37862 RepID=A0A1I7XG20_HETBA